MWLLLSLATSAWAARAPCWVSAPCAPYADATHVVGVGSGATPAAAEDAARAAIAKVFSVRIARTEEALVSASRGSGGEDRRSTLTVTTRSETDRQLQGVRIAERWAAKDGTVWALAVLDRGPAADALAAEVAAAEAALADLSGTPVEQVRKLERALPVAEKLAYLAEELSVVRGAAVTPSVTWDALARRRDAARAALTVAVEGTLGGAPWAPALHEAAAAAITGEGLAVGAEGAALRVRVTLTETAQRPDADGFVKIVLQGAIAVLEGESTVAEAPVRAEAASRSVDKARAVATGEVAAALAAAGPLVAGVLR